MSQTILIVEDNANNRTLLCDILSFYGYEVATVNDGNKALTRWPRN